MKKLLFILGATLTLTILFVACKTPNDTVTITTNRNIYNPAMSYARGVEMTPDFNSKKKYTKLEYRWITNEGQFINDYYHLGKEVKNTGEPVVWSSTENDKVIHIKNSFSIRLEVVDPKSQKILANTELIVKHNKDFYEIQK